MPEEDHKWVSQALFHYTSAGQVGLDATKLTKLWFDPPPAQLICTRSPLLDRYFTHRLLVWMPRRMWRMTLHCPHPECNDHQLTSAGIYPRVRQVLDLEGYYNLATEYLECKKCKRKLCSWGGAIVNQLDIGHRQLFPVLLTYQYACDIRVAKLMRQRGLGNSATQLQKKLEELHHEAWLNKCLIYATECQLVVAAERRGLVTSARFPKPPPQVPVPKYRWLMQVYCNDVMRRVEAVKGSVTSIFGKVLKLDSTKKIVRKRSGHAAGTASWSTNVGNEYGQVLMSVLTAAEGSGLGPMIAGLVKRYSDAGVEPPRVLYVDKGCCNDHNLRRMFNDWPDLVYRLDIWHFMRRFSSVCTTDAHPLYALFMRRLSASIFEWSAEDLEALVEAKRTEFVAQLIPHPSSDDALRRLTTRELSRHCRRTTRGVEQTTTLIEALLESLMGESVGTLWVCHFSTTTKYGKCGPPRNRTSHVFRIQLIFLCTPMSAT